MKTKLLLLSALLLGAIAAPAATETAISALPASSVPPASTDRLVIYTKTGSQYFAHYLTFGNLSLSLAPAWSAITGTPTTLSGYGITDASPIAGSSSIVTLGTVTGGTWHGTAIADSYISSAATWNAKQSALVSGTDYLPITGGTGVVTLGTIATGVWHGTAIADSYISSAATWNAKESALTFSTGLTRSTNTITVNTSQNIATLSNLTSNGFVKTSGDTGTLSIDTSTYLTGNQTITLSGDVSGSGTTAITTTIGSGKVTNAMLAGSIAASKLVGTDITTVGTLSAGAVPTTLLTGTITNAQLAGSIATTKLASATTVGGNILALTNPSAISFVKIAADNTVSTRTPAQVLSDIGAQASGSYAGSGANADITSLSGVTAITGGAGNMTITSGTGNSRTLTLRTTTSGGVATNAIVIGATQVVAMPVGATAGSVTPTDGNSWALLDPTSTFAGVITGLNLAATRMVSWSSTGGWYGTGDLTISRNAAGVLQIGTTTNNASGSLTCTNGTFSGTLAVTGAATFSSWTKDQVTTVSGLPSASTAGAGAKAFVTDAVSFTIHTAPTGGGSVKTPVYSDGTNWLMY